MTVSRLRFTLAKGAGWAKSLYNDFKEFLSPSACLCCGRERDFADLLLCPECIRKLNVRNIGSGPVCPYCGEIAGENSYCRFCIQKESLDFYFWGIYDNELKECILKFKFHGAIDLGKRLSEMAAGSLIERLAQNDYDLIVPLPLHRARKRERQFNQSEVIAEVISNLLGIELGRDILLRIRSTRQQAKLAEKDRWNNVKGAFVISNDLQDLLKGKRILLVDDIVTTGATIYEASRPLLSNGIKRLDVFSLAYAK